MSQVGGIGDISQDIFGLAHHSQVKLFWVVSRAVSGKFEAFSRSSTTQMNGFGLVVWPNFHHECSFEARNC